MTGRALLWLAVLAARPAGAQYAVLAPDFAQCDVMLKPALSCGYGVCGLGLLELSGGNVLYSHVNTGELLSFPLAAACPGTAAVPAVLGTPSLGCLIRGIDGRVYASLAAWAAGSSGVLELNPVTGAAVRTVISGLPVLGLALDPRTGDLYGTSGGGIWRIASPESASPVATFFANATAYSGNLDGLAWSCDGEYLLAASDEPSSEIVRVGRDGTVSLLVALPAGTQPDGICFGAPGTPLFGHAYTNNNNGSVTEIPLDDPAAWRIIASGSGLRGDFLIVDSRGDLLLSQNERVTRLHSTQAGRFTLPGSSLCSNMECSSQADLACIKNKGIRTSIRVAIPFICDETNPPNARLARCCNCIDKIKKHSPECTLLLQAFRAMRDYLIPLAGNIPDCSGE